MTLARDHSTRRGGGWSLHHISWQANCGYFLSFVFCLFPPTLCSVFMFCVHVLLSATIPTPCQTWFTRIGEVNSPESTRYILPPFDMPFLISVLFYLLHRVSFGNIDALKSFDFRYFTDVFHLSHLSLSRAERGDVLVDKQALEAMTSTFHLGCALEVLLAIKYKVRGEMQLCQSYSYPTTSRFDSISSIIHTYIRHEEMFYPPVSKRYS